MDSYITIRFVMYFNPSFTLNNEFISVNIQHATKIIQNILFYSAPKYLKKQYNANFSSFRLTQAIQFLFTVTEQNNDREKSFHFKIQ